MNPGNVSLVILFAYFVILAVVNVAGDVAMAYNRRKDNESQYQALIVQMTEDIRKIADKG